ncbi:hypothetical protein [Mucilaginibacter xinganensis]|uniref:Outer membrane protein beta-barrel domain-containing protein n=1 Tax=Mucilaginibacter xinganensis TaxID=1234841 RepID=A0A223NUR8_9SPHI|nr:hypothetical protein [Mucilaginibacter xinganensis]ASU33261.1 hypothetical protein MuYL_1363 [Mucilaginibacter xinganensis]
MKKILLSLIISGITAVSALAQTKSDGGKFSAGFESGILFGSISDISTVAIGGSVKYDYPIADKTFLTLTAGYTNLIYKSDYKEILKELGVDKSGEGYVPVKLGIKYYLSGGFFGEAQGGVVFSTESGGGTAIAYSPGFGYTWDDRVELGARYEAWSNNGTVSQAALRIAYKF